VWCVVCGVWCVVCGVWLRARRPRPCSSDVFRERDMGVCHPVCCPLERKGVALYMCVVVLIVAGP
jgi:hypothetical protein